MTDIVTGLTTEEVNKLKEQGLDNIPVGNQSKTIGQIIAGNVFTYFNFVFAVFAALLILVRSYSPAFLKFSTNRHACAVLPVGFS